MLRTGEFQQRAAELGEHLHSELGLLVGGGAVDAVRGPRPVGRGGHQPVARHRPGRSRSS